MMGSRIMLVTAPASWVSMDRVVFPVACSIRSKFTERKMPRLNVVTSPRYWVPISRIMSAS